ncbi:T9SS type A sorting domain-containing protein [Psychroflexus sp. ALD_RP9]|uniref:T9SS type A sorting domain-containing protein n=1 Tax=Psychroflexus sp. ALD_RP9 TaxID=2777186 RepID=UPI001A8C6775|nr:T9SS type A sorting domain-containing protein [Psychroflexus sp. ALD_RP9]QSS96254.1 T9SS type A sorting domain-containing protein [Psychroflexus sp. ALD_RP9]
MQQKTNNSNYNSWKTFLSFHQNKFKIPINLILISCFILFNISSYGQSGSVTETYTSGDIPTDVSDAMACSAATGSLTVTIPSGKIVTSVDIAYDMTAASGAWQSEQRSRIRVTNNGNEESFISGSGSSGGTFSYNRTITLADGLTDTSITFELDVYRTYGPGFTPTGCNTTYNKVDDGTWSVTVNYDDAPSCIAPINLTTSSISSSTVDLNWDTETTATSGYDWVIVASGDDPDVGPFVDSANGVTGTSVSASGLSGNTDYDAYVKSDCGGGDKSDWSSAVSFTTLCNTVINFPYTESFTTFLNDCWEEATGTNTNITSTGTSSWGSDSFNGDDSAYYNMYTNTTAQWLVTENFDLGTTTDYRLALGIAASAYNNLSTPANFSVDDEVGLVISTDDGASWTSLGTYTDGSEPSNTGQTDTYDLSSYTGTVKFGIYAVASSGFSDHDLYITDFTVEEIPSCITPANLAVSNITSSGADLDWDTEATASSGYDWVIVASGDDPDVGPFVDSANGVTGTSVSASGLSPNTDYDAYVRSDCGGGDKSDWSSAVSFTTACNTESLPWTEDFENAGATPDCWTESGGEAWNYDTTGAGENIGDGGTITGSTDSGNYFAWIDNSGSQGPSTLTSPFIDLSSLTTPQVAFYMISDSGSDPNATLDVEVYDGSSWNNVGSFSADTNGWERKEIALSSLTFTGDAQVRFTITDEGGFRDDIAIDDVTFEEAPSCITPENLSVSNITSSGVDLDWDLEATASSGYDWVIVASGDDPDVGPFADSANGVTGTSVSASGLSGNTDYDAYVRSDCGGGDKSDWSSAVSFTTLKDFCAGDLATDSGGVGSDYSSSANETITICPDNPGDKVVINFSEFSFENNGTGCYDGLTVYDGNNTSAATIDPPAGGTQWCWDRDDTTASGSGDLLGVSIAATSASGCITLVLESDGSVTREGFTASVSCESTVYLWDGTAWTNEPDGFISANDNLYVNAGGTPDISSDVNTNNIFVDNGATLDINPTASLNLSNDMVNYGTITFKSNATSTAQLDEFTGTISGTGTVEVERYIPAKRAFRLISSAVDGSTIANAWQQDTHITGAGGATNGFDATNTDNPSMFTFDNTITDQSSGAGWQAITSTTDVISAGTPYRLMVRGDRTIDLADNEAPATATTLSASGSLQTGSYTPTLATAANNYSFVGNPYQAVVDFGAVTKSNLTDFIYVWDASIAGSNGNGGYITVQISTGNITAPSPSSSDASQYIAPGQAFFVQNNASGNGSITFKEADKATGQSQVSIFSTYTNFYINSRLYKASALQNGEMESDAIGLRFNENYTTIGSDEDASKLANPGENYAIVNNGFKSIDKQNIPTDGHQVDLLMMNYEDTAYSLSFNLGNQPETLKVYLNDSYLNTQTELTESTTYDFTVDANVPESIDQNRFHLSFEEVPLNNQSFDAGQVRLYPNPVVHQLQIELPASVEINSVQVFNTLGQQVLTTTQSQVDMSQLASGVYVVELETTKGKVSKKIIKQ